MAGVTRRRHKPRLFEGLPLVDGTRKIKITVLPRDIKGSRKADPGNCAAARAGQREMHKDVRVFLTRTYVKEKDHWERYFTPQSASREIVSFDRGGGFSPGEYIMKPATPGQRLGVEKPVGPHKHTGMPTTPKHQTVRVRSYKEFKK